MNREDFSFVIHLDRQPRTSRRREAQTGSRARSGSRSERTLDAVEHSRTLMEWWPFLIFHRGGLRIKVINNTAEDGRLFCCGFFDYYNFHHRHSGIGLMTPADVHYGRAEQLTTARRQILLEAQQAHPERFVRGTPQPPVLPPQAWINPPLEKTTLHDAAQAPLAAASIPGVPPFSASRNQILVDVDVDRADLTSLPTIIEAH